MITKPHIVTSRQAHIVDNPEETLMKKFSVAALIGFATLFGASTSVLASEQECKKLKNDHDVIYASKGFCFKDPEAKAKFGNDIAIQPNQNSRKKSNNVLTRSKIVRKN